MKTVTSFGAGRYVKLAAILLLLMAAQLVYAGDINVEGKCSLAEAIQSANRNKPIGGCERGYGTRDTIIMHKNQDRGNTLPTVTSPIHLEGAGHSITFGDVPAFRVEDGTLILQNVNIRFRQPRHGDLMVIEDGDLTLANAIFHDCTGGIDANRSTISMEGISGICHHGMDVILAWFGVYPPEPATCEALSGVTVSAPLGLGSGVQCQHVDGAGIGNQSVADAGVIDAVDIWGYVEQGVHVCFPQAGAITFLDAATAPRSVVPVETYRSGAMTCAYVDRAGTLVLVPGETTTELTTVAPIVEATTPVTEATTPVTAVAATTTDGCPIHTTGFLFLRDAPSLQGVILGVVPRGTNLVSPTRTQYWYQVNYQGQTGWIGHKYVRAGC